VSLTFKDVNLLEVGHTTQLVGAIYMDDKNSRVLLCPFPDEASDLKGVMIEYLYLNADEWAQVLLQGDVLNVEILIKESDGQIKKAIVRKGNRNIDQSISWKVFRRDSYTCRYCGANDVPLTVDHIILWEAGGPSTFENLITACKKCNRVRGNTPYRQWILSTDYQNRSRALSPITKNENMAVIGRLDSIQTTDQVRSR
jgi:HNH endonuclease